MNSPLSGKKLLILAGNDVHVKLVTAARELGVHTIVADYLPIEESPAKSLADEYWNISTSDIDLLSQKCREEHVDGVLNYCIDTVQMAYRQLCSSLNLPCFASEEIFKSFTNKRLFKDFCLSHGVGVVPEYTVEQLLAGDVEYPVLIKPSDSRGSRGITICRDGSNVHQALELARSESRDGGVIVEKYMEGVPDMGLAFFVKDGEPYLVKISDRMLGWAEDGLQCQQMASILPSRYAPAFIRDSFTAVAAMIKSTGIKFGPVFIQGFWENGRFLAYDPGVRFPGSEFDSVMKSVTGFDMMKSFVDFALTGNVSACYGDPLDVYDYRHKVCVIFAVSCRAGVIATFDGVAQLERHKSILSVRQIFKVGQEVKSTGDVRQRVLELVAVLENRAELPSFAGYVYDTLKILDAGGKDMVVSKLRFDDEEH